MILKILMQLGGIDLCMNFLIINGEYLRIHIKAYVVSCLVFWPKTVKSWFRIPSVDNVAHFFRISYSRQ